MTRNQSDGSTLPARQARLSIVHCPDPNVLGTAFRLTRDAKPLVIGRKPDESQRIVDPQLSRVHARVVWDPAEMRFRVGDAQSKNGTFLNRTRTESALLGDGDVLRTGDTLFVYDEGDPMVELRETVQRAAQSGLVVLLLGETGSGKELVARSLHEQSRCPGRFVAVNCGGLPRELVAAELFGYVQGAFSGARSDRAGLFSSATDGTLFLDEIGDLPLETQPALLRVLQEKTVRRVGSDKEIATTARVLAATHADLRAACQRNRFRSDLYARLAQIVIEVPPLRKRRRELIELARSFARGSLELTPDAAETLLTWHFPRNVRELKALVESFEALSDETLLTRHALKRIDPQLVTGASEPALAAPGADEEEPNQDEAQRLRQLLEAHQGNVSSVARKLKKSRSQVYRLMKDFGLAAGAGRRRL